MDRLERSWLMLCLAVEEGLLRVGQAVPASWRRLVIYVDKRPRLWAVLLGLQVVFALLLLTLEIADY